MGAETAYIDEAYNVVLKIDGEVNEMVVFAAHIDTVFPDMEPMTFTEDEKNIRTRLRRRCGISSNADDGN